VTPGTLRLPALPRDVAAALTVSSVSRAVWAIAAGVLLLTVVGVVALTTTKLVLPGGVLVPIGALLLMVAALLVVARFPSTTTLLVYLVVGTGCVWLFQFALLSADPGLQQSALFILNRPAFALVLVGTASASPLSAVWWGVSGFVAGLLATIVVALQLNLPLLTGAGPAIALANYVIAFLAIALIQRSQRGRAPDVTSLVAEARLREAQRTVDRSAAALIHDTVLNDLALVMTAPAELDDRARERLRADLDTVARAERNLHADATAGPGNLDGAFRKDLTALITDFQWRGLSVDVAVDPDANLGLSESSASAAVGAVRACLENVLNHSGVTSAELTLGGDGSLVTVMIVDAGVGFDRDLVPSDRLGLRSSVVHRIESVGGAVRIWSAPDLGATVLLSLPLPAAVPSARETADA
jgi:signal transduction histidine kinase